jgi:hypothetical protein
MRRVVVSFLFYGFVLSPLCLASAAAQDLPAPELRAEPSTEATRFLPGTASAVVGRSASVTNAWGGFDGAARSAVASVTTELRVFDRVSLDAGFSYGATSAPDTGLRPQLGARVQFLDQARAGVDASAAFLFREDRFTSEDGLFQGSLAIGRSFGATSAVVNVVYGQDGEGDDHEGEVRLAALRRVRGGLHLGAEGRYMHSLASTDPHRAALGTPSMEAMAAALAAYTTGPWAFVLEGGVGSRRTTDLETGLVALAGVGTAF